MSVDKDPSRKLLGSYILFAILVLGLGLLLAGWLWFVEGQKLHKPIRGRILVVLLATGVVAFAPLFIARSSKKK